MSFRSEEQRTPSVLIERVVMEGDGIVGDASMSVDSSEATTLGWANAIVENEPKVEMAGVVTVVEMAKTEWLVVKDVVEDIIMRVG